MKVWATSHQRMSTSDETKTSSERGKRSKNRQSKIVACNIKSKLHNQPQIGPEPLCFKQLSCPKLSDDGHLEAEIKAQFPNNRVTALSFAELPNINTAWLAPLALGLAQVQAATWSHNLGFNVDDPFAGKGTLSRVVSGVTLYEVTA